MTKQEKLEAYTYCLLCALAIEEITEDEFLESRPSCIGVCNNLNDYMHHINNNNYGGLEFTEFLEQRPQPFTYMGLWWLSPWSQSTVKPPHSGRIQAICKAIELTEKLKS